VHGDDRYDRVAAALRPAGTLALFWNKGREWIGALGRDNDAAYAEHAPDLHSRRWDLGWVVPEIDACLSFDGATVRSVTWSCTYTRDEWLALLGTHSDHRILPEEQRTRLHAAVGDVTDRHGGPVDVVYDCVVYLSRRV
jgi:hypothetical protein